MGTLNQLVVGELGQISERFLPFSELREKTNIRRGLTALLLKMREAEQITFFVEEDDTISKDTLIILR